EDVNGSPLTTAELADLIAKVVRELGQPELARSFAQRPPRARFSGESPVELNARDWRSLTQAAASSRLREVSMNSVFSRDQIAAHRDRLLTISGLEHPFELAGSVLAPANQPDQGLFA